MYIGVSPGGQGGAAAPPPRNLGNLEFLGRKRNLGKLISKEVCMCVCMCVCVLLLLLLLLFFSKRDIFYCKLKSAGLSQLNSHKTVVA